MNKDQIAFYSSNTLPASFNAAGELLTAGEAWSGPDDPNQEYWAYTYLLWTPAKGNGAATISQANFPSNFTFYSFNSDHWAIGQMDMPVLDAGGNPTYDPYGSPVVSPRAALCIPAQFSLRQNSAVVQGWDSTGVNGDPAPWTVVAVGATNNLVKLTLPANAQKLGLELAVPNNSTQYISIANNQITGVETDFSIQGLATNVNPNRVRSAVSASADVVLRVHSTGQVLLTLHVAVLTPRTEMVNVWYLSDSTNTASALPSNAVSATNIISYLNSYLGPQTATTFALNKTASYDTLKDAKVNNAFDANGQLQRKSPGVDAIKQWADGLAKQTLDVLVVRKTSDGLATDDVGGFGSAGFAFVSSDADPVVFAHEAGHAKGLATQDFDGERHDQGPWPVEFHTDALQEIGAFGGLPLPPRQTGLMFPNGTFANAWIRQADWITFNTTVGAE